MFHQFLPLRPYNLRCIGAHGFTCRRTHFHTEAAVTHKECHLPCEKFDAIADKEAVLAVANEFVDCHTTSIANGRKPMLMPSARESPKPS